MAIEKISTDKIQVGMYVDRIDISWFRHPFLTSSFLISDDKELQKLKKLQLPHIFINTEKGFYSFSEGPYPAPPSLAEQFNIKGLSSNELYSLEDKTTLPEEIKTVRKVYAKTRQVIEDVFHTVKKGKEIQWEAVFNCVDALTGNVLRHKDAFLSLSMIKHHDNYTFYHSLNVCCLSLTLGRFLHYNKEDLIALGVGALLHDIGKVKIPQAILNKPGPLTDQEFSIMKKHPEYSFEILSESSSLRWDSIHLTYEHHERFGGNGYPRGLKGDRINQFARIAAIVDVFDAITTDRPYRQAMSANEAMKNLFDRGERDFYPPMLLKFAQCMGTYPISTTVELSSKEIGVVIGVNHQYLERPKVLCIYDSDHHKPNQPYLADLTSEHYKGIYIKKCLEAKKVGFDIPKLLESVKI